MAEPVDFPTFFLLWAEERRWKVPDIHWRAVHWLEHRGNLAVLRCFRGFAKSTILAIYNAWRYYDDPSYRILHQGDQDKTAYKTSRDTQAVLRRHPLTRDLCGGKTGIRGESSFWWHPKADDERNPSMQAAGITSNITSSRCDEAQNDDVEVPRNIQNAEAREKMRYRLSEQTHIMVPGARQLFVGTPHTHDSLYDEMEAMGADCLTIKMFASEHRIENAAEKTYDIGFVPEILFAGIGKSCRALKLGNDYKVSGTKITFARPPVCLVDCYAGSAWPERFDLAELESRRKKCKTINEWDSQYQLHSRPLHEVRLNPERIRPYDAEPTIRSANGELSMWLGGVQIVGASLKWDPSSGKVRSDVSSASVMLFDDLGGRYWHRALELKGEVARFDADGKTITGGQVFELVEAIVQLHLRGVVVETNGAGTFAPAILKAALNQARSKGGRLRWPVGVREKHETVNKNKRILEAFEGALTSGKLWAHVSVLDVMWDQMRDFNPASTEQPDDHLDSGAGALTEAPERIGKISSSGWIPPGQAAKDWRPATGDLEVELES